MQTRMLWGAVRGTPAHHGAPPADRGSPAGSGRSLQLASEGKKHRLFLHRVLMPTDTQTNRAASTLPSSGAGAARYFQRDQKEEGLPRKRGSPSSRCRWRRRRPCDRPALAGFINLFVVQCISLVVSGCRCDLCCAIDGDYHRVDWLPGSTGGARLSTLSRRKGYDRLSS
jgi:hypothetical protein